MKQKHINLILRYVLYSFVPVLCAGLFLAGCPKSKKNSPVILIIVDALPAGHVTSYGYKRSITSNIDRLAKDGILFERAVSASPWTLPSFGSILTGLYPSTHFAGWHLDPPSMDDRRLSVIRPEIKSMAEYFAEDGYQTIGFFNNPFLHPGYGLDKGFNKYDYFGGDLLNIRSAPLVTDAAIKWIEENDKEPFFMVMHFFDPHMAYDPPLASASPYIYEYKGKLKKPFIHDARKVCAGDFNFSKQDKDFIIGLYDGEVSSTDQQIGRFFQYLKTKGLYDGALIVLTSDHGEEFWEHGGFEHGHSLHKEVIEVPLIMKYPESDLKGHRVSEYVSHMDIFPTIAEFMGWPVTSSLNGVSLYPRGGKIKIPSHTVVSENMHYGPQKQSFIYEDTKLIIENATGKITVYDLKNDPTETKNVFGEVELPAAVQEQVKQIAKDLEKVLKEKKLEEVQLDQETIKKLKSLKYL